MSTRTLHKSARVEMGLIPVIIAGLVGCGGSAARDPISLDCAGVDAQYEFSTPLLDAEIGSPNHPLTYFGAGDNTPGCLANPPGVVDSVPVGNLTLDDAGLPVIDASICTIQENVQGSSFFPTTQVSAARLSYPGTPEYNATVTTPVHRSLVFHSQGCTNWGSNASHSPPGAPVMIPYQYASCNQYTSPAHLEQITGYWDGSAFEGIGFWARTPGVSNHSVMLTLNNADTAVEGPTVSCYLPYVPRSRCTPAPSDATAGLGLSVVDFQSGTATAGGVPGRIPLRGECGNAFQRVLTTTPDWQFYKLPFDTFYQLPYPNRIDSGFDSSTLLQISVIFPKEVRTELWITNFRFYRRKGADAGNGSN